MISAPRRPARPRLMLAIAACVALLPLRGARAAEPDPALVAAAVKEGQVTWYSTLIVNQIVRPMVAAFERTYPAIKVAYSRAGASDTALRIRNEARVHRIAADLFDGSETVFLLKEAGLVAPYHPQVAAHWPADLRDADGYWTALSLFYWTAAVNTDLVKPGEEPRTYDDLLDPRWKGRIAWTANLTSGGPPGFIHNILTIKGRQQGMAWMKRFAAQQPVSIPASQRVVLDKVIDGEYPLCVMILNYHVTISRAKGAPVTWLHMEPLLQTMSTVSVVQGAPHPNAARLLEEFMLSDEGQKVLAASGYIPASPDVAANDPRDKPRAGHFTVTVVSPREVRDDTPKWIALYHELFR